MRGICTQPPGAHIRLSDEGEKTRVSDESEKDYSHEVNWGNFPGKNVGCSKDLQTDGIKFHGM